MLTRRQFLRSCALAGGYALLPLGRSGFAFASQAPADRRLIVIFLRGAVDGLSVVVPYQESAYYEHRSTIALRPPGQEDGVLDLDGFFGLNPSLSMLMPYWRDKSLAFVHASGYPSDVRSHFEGQDMIETASLDSIHARQGWMNGLIRLLPDTRTSTRALSFSNALPKIFTGPNEVATVPGGLKADSKSTFDNAKIEHPFDLLYAHNPALNGIYNEGKTAHDQLIDDLKKEMEAANQNAPYPDGFPGQAARVGAMIKHDPGIELVFMDLGGWDTHVNQGNAKGQLANRLQKLGEGLATLVTALGSEYTNTSIMVISEFGRTVAENGNNGTDHGHGNAIWLMGGGVSGGKIWGRWPGLSRDTLFQQRDLAVTTDFRAVIGAVLSGHFGLQSKQIAQIIADYKPDSAMHGIIT